MHCLQCFLPHYAFHVSLQAEYTRVKRELEAMQMMKKEYEELRRNHEKLQHENEEVRVFGRSCFQRHARTNLPSLTTCLHSTYCDNVLTGTQDCG